MQAAQRLYVVRIGVNRFIVETTHPNKALVAILRAIRAAASVHVCSPMEAFELAGEGATVMRASDIQTWPRVDDRTLELPAGQKPYEHTGVAA
jgi:hypothetical protein